MNLSFSPDGRFVACGSRRKTVRIWDPESREELRSFAGHAAGVPSVAWAPDGRYLASGSQDKTVRLWDAEGGTETRCLAGHASGVSSVAWSPDGLRIVSGSLDTTVRLWDTESGDELQCLKHEAGVTSVAFSPDGLYVASAHRTRPFASGTRRRARRSALSPATPPASRVWLSRPALSGDGGSGLEDDFGLAADSGIDLEGGGTEDGLAVEVEGVDYELADATISSSDDDFLLTPDDDFENDFADESGTQVIALDEGDDSFPASPVDEFGDEDLDATTFAASPPRRSSSFGRASPAPRPPQKEATLRNVLLLALFALAALVVLFTAALLTKMNDSDEEPPTPPSVRQSTPGTTRSRLAMRSADGQSTCPPVGDVAVHSRSRARA